MDHLDQPLPGHMQDISAFRQLLFTPSGRLTCPDSVAHPEEPDSLQTSMIESWRAAEPSQDSRLKLLRLIKDLTHIINAEYGGYAGKEGQRFYVDVFGSVSWGGDTGHSGDVDLIILDRQLLHGYVPTLWRRQPGEPERTPKETLHKRDYLPVPIPGVPGCYDTMAMADTLKRAGFEDVKSVPTASTPINKFKYADLECDLNANDLGGWYNSSLLLHYCSLSPYVLRPMIHTLKLWSSSHDLNDPSGARGPATMSSYCLALMAIAYLQHLGHLPNLQEVVKVPEVSRPEDTSEHDVVWVSWGKEEGIKARVAFSLELPEGWVPKEKDLTAADAIRGFFEFFSLSGTTPLRGERFDRNSEIVSILMGGIVPRAKAYGQEDREASERQQLLENMGVPAHKIKSSNDEMRLARIAEEPMMGKGDRGIQPRKWGQNRLVVQDPFLWLKNCASQMSKGGLDRWWTTIDNTHRVMKLRGKSFTVSELIMM
ncbi:hypothetical protein B9479_000720 [Cryptococcus floricola]|uniref:Poly(A) RNA polymerase mitochondrial-like central palm domain-containing protein n=1 Tax=Cryptococcus floricola TaxID=2591691 RepID=A0A5D3B6E6_9TREE|nr:hypothetical protein B9479_000720 [Cryptococcus floricola]